MNWHSNGSVGTIMHVCGSAVDFCNSSFGELHGQRKYISDLGCFKCVPHVSMMTVILVELKTSLMISLYMLMEFFISYSLNFYNILCLFVYL